MTALLALAAALFSGCERKGAGRYESARAGDPDAGQQLLFMHGCGVCHMIPGVANANGTVGPPLERLSRRTYVAGSLINTPENLIRWIVEPHAIDPETAMPDMRVDPGQAKHMAAYLYTLR